MKVFQAGKLSSSIFVLWSKQSKSFSSKLPSKSIGFAMIYKLKSKKFSSFIDDKICWIREQRSINFFSHLEENTSECSTTFLSLVYLSLVLLLINILQYLGSSHEKMLKVFWNYKSESNMIGSLVNRVVLSPLSSP